MADSNKTYRLNELTEFIRRVFALNLPSAVWIAAEIGQANESRGNIWLTLVQKEAAHESIVAQLDGVVWQSSLKKLHRQYGLKLIRSLFKDGLSVRLKVTTSFHHRYGLRLVVEDIDPNHTLGELERIRRTTLNKLTAAGLLHKNAAIPLCSTPLHLAVISSDTAAGLADFRQQLEENTYGYRFKTRLFSAAMQGAQTGAEVQSRLRQILKWGEAYDAVVIVRGGGARTNLAAFDDEGLATAVANYPVPVICGIGHETDDSVLDKVVHTSLKTPTAVAVYLLERVARAEAELLYLSRALHRVATGELNGQHRYLAAVPARVRYLATTQLNREQNRIDRIAGEVRRLPQVQLREARTAVNNLETLLTALRPETTLARGYALVSQQGKLITDPTDLESGKVELRLKRGRVHVDYKK